MRHLARLALTLLATTVLLTGTTAGAQAALIDWPMEDYASYDPQSTCAPKAKPGSVELLDWLVSRYPGTTKGGISRPCSSGGTSEHKEGRALDWMVDWREERQRAKAERFLTKVFATDARGNEHALARRMGIMYVIWDDRIYSSYRDFAARDYLSSSCRQKSTCSRTLRHRDHVHISLSRPGGRGDTSWYHRDETPPVP